MKNQNAQVSAPETAKILQLAQTALAVPGDFVEMGCFAGDTSIELAELLRGTTKQLYLYDSFAGLPAKTSADYSPLGQNFTPGALAVTKRFVKSRFLRANLPVPHITKAWFSDLTPADLPTTIAFAFLDGDLYTSIRDSLKLVLPKISPGGLILVHDYQNPALPGVEQAVHECLPPRASLTKYHSLAVIVL